MPVYYKIQGDVLSIVQMGAYTSEDFKKRFLCLILNENIDLKINSCCKVDIAPRPQWTELTAIEMKPA